jgi:hypothetical protein
VKSVSTAGDQAHVVVERFGSSLVDPEADRGEDPVAVLADRFPEADERLKSAASEAGGEPVDQDGDVVEGESGLKDSADGFFEHVATPNLAAGGFEPLERDGLLVGEVLRSFQQRPARVFEALGGVLVTERAQLARDDQAGLDRGGDGGG